MRSPFLNTHNQNRLTWHYPMHILAKNEIAQKPEFRTAIVRLKEKLGFSYDNFHLFQSEIIKQFQDGTGLKLSPIPIFIFNRLTNTLNQMNNLKDKFI